VEASFVVAFFVQKPNLKHLRIAAFQCWSCVHGCVANQWRRAQKQSAAIHYHSITYCLAMHCCSSSPILYFSVSLFFKFLIPLCFLVWGHIWPQRHISKSICKSILSIIVIALVVTLGPALLLLNLPPLTTWVQWFLCFFLYPPLVGSDLGTVSSFT
jgi:hypothetical protein